MTLSCTSYYDLARLVDLSCHQLTSKVSVSCDELERIASLLRQAANNKEGMSLLLTFQIHTQLGPVLNHLTPLMQISVDFIKFMSVFLTQIETQLRLFENKNRDLEKGAQDLFWNIKVRLAKLQRLVRKIKYSASLIRIHLADEQMRSHELIQADFLQQQLNEIIVLANTLINNYSVSVDIDERQIQIPESNERFSPSYKLFNSAVDPKTAEACFTLVLAINELVQVSRNN